MEYKRFLRNSDYIGLINDDHLEQISDGLNEDKFKRVEEDAEICVIENMIENYEIEAELKVGKDILDYDERFVYPKNVRFWYSGKVVRTLKEIAGVGFTEESPHWKNIPDPSEEQMNDAVGYTQLNDYYVGSIVLKDEYYYECLLDNGYGFDNIRVPGRVITEDTDAVLPQFGVNIVEDDPRNKNLKKHMTRLALYDLYKSISPNNVPLATVNDYESSAKWLQDCNKMRITPTIPRKVDSSGNVSTDWALATFSNPATGNIWSV